MRSGKVDAILVPNDSVALPLVSRVQESGVRVPEDPVVVTHDDELVTLAAPTTSC